MIRSLEMTIAMRYLRARRGSRLLSFISLIAIGGVVVGVSALTVVMAVMNGLQRDLREKILIGSPDLRLLDVRQRDEHARLAGDAGQGEEHAGRGGGRAVGAHEGLARSRANDPQLVFISGIEPQARGVVEVTGIRHHAIQGTFGSPLPTGFPTAWWSVTLSRLG